MTPEAEPFTAADIERLRAQAWLGSLEFHREIASTNDRALAWAGSGDVRETPRLLLTNRQTAGRGRGRNAWWASDGALTFSLVLELGQLGLASDKLPQLSLATALGVCDGLAATTAAGPFQLKWPNDVYVGDRKLAGILLEAPPARRDRVVVGIGVNINNSLAAAPDDIRATATSLVDELRQPSRLVDVLGAILSALQTRYTALASGRLDFSRAWSERCWLQGEVVEVTIGRDKVVGHCHGLDCDGALLVQVAEHAAPQRFLSGTVRRVT